MREKGNVFRTLVSYFFMQFFQNDLVHQEGDTVTTIVRAVSVVAVPGLMDAFFLQNQYPRRSTWGRIEDHYFFVLYSFLAMAGIAIFEWAKLFPDKLDFQVLAPLPVRDVQMLGAKATALAGFLMLFLFAANVFGACVLPMVSREVMFRQMGAQVLATGGAGLLGALTILGAGSTMLCVIPLRWFRAISPLLQMLSVMTFGLMFMHYVQFGDLLDALLSHPAGATRWMPSFWFLGVYEKVQRSGAAAPFAGEMARRAVYALAIAFGVVALSYPLAWKRMQRLAVEGDGAARVRKFHVHVSILNRVERVPAARAVMHFIGQTLRRDSRYHVYLAIYCGVGLTLAMACATTFAVHGATLRLQISRGGLRAVVPLLLFWAIAGLRIVFGVPLGLSARWIFRVTGADREVCVTAARRWAQLFGLGLLAVLLPVLFTAGLNLRAVLVQMVCGVCVCRLMVEGLLFSDRGIPFTQPRSPGRTSLPLMLTLYVGVLPSFVIAMAWVARWLERRVVGLIFVVAAVPAVRWLVKGLRRNSQATLEDGDEIEPEFQLLGLGVE